jgi:LysM repeat protein
MFPSLARIGVPVIAGALLLGLSSCGDDDNSAAVSTVQIRPSSYSIKEPATTTTVPTSAVADAQGRSPAEQTFIVKTNKDVPFNIAKLYDIKLEELRNYNGWAADFHDAPGIGGTVRIPPGAKFIDPNATTTTAAATGGSTSGSGSSPASSTPAGDRCHPTYTVKAGDAPLVVTRKFDITIDQLNAANTDTPNWPNLYTGRTIKLPPPADCPTRSGAPRPPPRPADPNCPSIPPASGRNRRTERGLHPRSGHRRVGGRRQPAMPWRRRVVRSHWRRHPV